MAELTSYEQKVKPLFDRVAELMGFHDYVFSSADAILLAEKRKDPRNDSLSDYEIAQSIVRTLCK